jgi:hypothetical protein
MTSVEDLNFNRDAGGSVSYLIRFTNTDSGEIEQLSAVGFEEMVALAVTVSDESHLTEVQVLRETHLTDVTYDIREHLNQ